VCFKNQKGQRELYFEYASAKQEHLEDEYFEEDALIDLWDTGEPAPTEELTIGLEFMEKNEVFQFDNDFDDFDDFDFDNEDEE
jgi:CTP:phosphocholine cytidylyltransferase-like protein